MAEINKQTSKKDIGNTDVSPSLANLMPPWKPGESGNPAGRPKGSRDKKKVLEELTVS